MSISQVIENSYKNIVISIKKMSKGTDRDLAIGSFIVDLGKRSIRAICNVLGISFRKAKQCVNLFLYGKQISFEFRGRKKITDKYPNLIIDIEKIIENYKNADSHFKTDTLFIYLNPRTIINELVTKYNYPIKFACYNTIHNIIESMGYKLHRIPKDLVIKKIPETDKIFENVNDELENISTSDDSVLGISIDLKATKNVGCFSDNGKTWLDNVKGLDHDTTPIYKVKPFGVLDIKTNQTFVTCTTERVTPKFEVDCIRKYIRIKQQVSKIKTLVIFLDNGPENSGICKAWLKFLTDTAKEFNITIRLVYYPPYHSKYNKIERYWARLQMNWNKIIIDSLNLLIRTISRTKWNGINTQVYMNRKEYDNVIISEEEMEEANKHIIREEGLEKWSIVIAPYEF